MSNDESSITHHKGGGITIAGADAMALYRNLHLKGAIKLYKDTDGGVIPTRGVTITRMLAMATTVTGKRYKRGLKGCDAAIADLQTWCDAMKAAMPIIDNTNT
jgi:hypothetical protein